MAGVLTLNLSGNLVNGGDRDAWSHGSLSIVQAAIGGYRPIISVGTSEEDMLVGDVGTLGYLFLKNLDETNYITYGPKSAGAMVAFGRIKPGEEACIRLEPGVTLRWIANTAAVKVKVWLLEN